MKIQLTFIGLFLTFSTLSGQVDSKQKPSWKDKVVTGGDVIVSISTGATQLGLSPILGYRITDRYTAGIGVTYIYGSFPSFTVQQFGGRIFNRFMVLEELFLQAELEQSRYTIDYELQRQRETLSFPALLLGGGYRNSIGGNSSVSIMVLYDVLQDPRSIYNGPIIRGGVNIGS